MDRSTITAIGTGNYEKTDTGSAAARTRNEAAQVTARRRRRRETDKAGLTKEDDSIGEHEYWFYKCLEEFNDPGK